MEGKSSRSTTASATAETSSDRSEVTVRVPNIFGWIPDEFWSHMKAAQREQMLALRTLLDAAIERTDEQKTPRRGRVDITVE